MAYPNPSTTYRPSTTTPTIDPTGQQILAPTWGGGHRISTGGVGSYNPTQAVKTANSLNNRVTNEGGVSPKGPPLTETGISTMDALANQNAQTASQNRAYSGGVVGVKGAPQKTDQQKEWDLLKQQAAASMATAKSEADIRTAALMQTAREGMYQSGAQAGSAAYRSAEQRAMDVGSLDRMGAVNEVAGQNLENTMQQQAKDTARSQEVSDREDAYQKQQKDKETDLNRERDDEMFATEKGRLETLISDQSLPIQSRLAYARQLDKLSSERYGTSTTSYEQQISDTPLKATASEQARAELSPLIAESTGVTDPALLDSMARAAYTYGITTPAQIQKYKDTGFLLNPRASEAGALIQKAKTSSNVEQDLTKEDWALIVSSPQWNEGGAYTDGEIVDVASRPSGKVGVGRTVAVDNVPYVVTKNPKGEGFYATNLVTGQKNVWIAGWGATTEEAPPKDSMSTKFLKYELDL